MHGAGHGETARVPRREQGVMQQERGGGGTWMTLQPAASRSTISCRRARASWAACTDRLTSLRGNDQFRIVTGPAAEQRHPGSVARSGD